MFRPLRSPFLGPVHTTLKELKNAALFLRLGSLSSLIRPSSSSNRRNLQTPALHFRVDGKHFVNRDFRKRSRHDNHVISLNEFSTNKIQNGRAVTDAFSNSSGVVWTRHLNRHFSCVSGVQPDVRSDVRRVQTWLCLVNSSGKERKYKLKKRKKFLSLFLVLFSSALPRTVRCSCASRREKSSKERPYFTNSCLSCTVGKRFLSNRSLVPHYSQQFIGTKAFGLHIEGLD